MPDYESIEPLCENLEIGISDLFRGSEEKNKTDSEEQLLEISRLIEKNENDRIKDLGFRAFSFGFLTQIATSIEKYLNPPENLLDHLFVYGGEILVIAFLILGVITLVLADRKRR